MVCKPVPQTTCRPLLPAGLREIRGRILDAPRLTLFLDFDGTLAPIVDDPADAHLDERTREVLEALSQRDGILVAIVSGRSVSDLWMRLGLERAIYAGNHGLEIRGPGLRFTEPLAAASRATSASSRSSAAAGSARRAGASPMSNEAPSAPIFLTGVLASRPSSLRGTLTSSSASSSA